MRRLIIVLCMMFSSLFIVAQTQNKKIIRSPVDLRDSTDIKPYVIIIDCSCECDSIPIIIIKDTIPVAKLIYKEDECIKFI